MTFLPIFIVVFLFFFLVLPLICYFVRIKSKTLDKLCPEHSRCRHNRNRNRNRNRPALGRRIVVVDVRQRNSDISYNDRQGNIFTISDDTSGNTGPNRFGDFFYLEPTSEDAARIRSQLEKDEKELPSYDEVMGMSNLATPTAAAAGMSSNTSIATADTMLDVPPYSEIDMISSTTPNITAAREGNSVDSCSGAATGAPSTSRAAASAVTITLPTTASNTMV